MGAIKTHAHWIFGCRNEMMLIQLQHWKLWSQKFWKLKKIIIVY